jgi:hypothetical protein
MSASLMILRANVNLRRRTWERLTGACGTGAPSVLSPAGSEPAAAAPGAQGGQPLASVRLSAGGLLLVGRHHVQAAIAMLDEHHRAFADTGRELREGHVLLVPVGLDEQHGQPIDDAVDHGALLGLRHRRAPGP